MTAKRIEFGLEAQKKIYQGIDKISTAVASTLGPNGRLALIQQSFGNPKITKDGATVAKSIELKDNLENIGATIIKDVANTANNKAGDGTTTATVLAAAIIKEAMKAIAAGMNIMDVKKGIDSSVDVISKELAKMSRKVTGKEEIAQVATISANGDSEIGNKIAEAVQKVGHDSPMTVEEAKGLEFEVTVVEGMNFDRGYLSPYFVTNSEKMTVELENPYILLCEKKVSNLQQLIPLLEAVVQSGRPLLIIAEDVEGEALATLVINKLRGGLKVAAVKAPGFGDRRKAILEDIACLTAGQLISEDLGMKLEEVSLQHLGVAKKVIIDKENTTIVDGAGKPNDVKARCTQIKKQIEETTSDYDREKLQERLAKISGGVAILKVGGTTELEVKEKKDRVEDAMHATKAAMLEGIVAGGGSALLYASKALDKLKTDNEDQAFGVKIIKSALQYPIRQIAENSGFDGAVIANEVMLKNDPSYGYDARNNKFVDMFKAGIVDPTKVTRTALQNAASVVGTLIATQVVIVDEKEDAPAVNPMAGGMGGMGGMGGF